MRFGLHAEREATDHNRTQTQQRPMWAPPVGAERNAVWGPHKQGVVGARAHGAQFEPEPNQPTTIVPQVRQGDPLEG